MEIVKTIPAVEDSIWGALFRSYEKRPAFPTSQNAGSFRFGMKALYFKKYKPHVFPEPLIGECPHFSSAVYPVEEKEVAAKNGCFASIAFLSGEGSFFGIPFKRQRLLHPRAKPTGKGECVYTTFP